MKLLWVLPKWPYPAVDGATKAHMALLENCQCDLDLVIFSDKPHSEEDIKKLKAIIGFSSLLILPLNSKSKNWLVLTSLFKKYSLPTTVKKFVSQVALEKFQDWSASKSWTHMVLDGLHPAGLFCLTKLNDFQWNLPKVQFIITRTHNVEAELWQQVRDKSSIFTKWIYRIEELRMINFEKSIYEKSNLIVPVSNIDATKIKLLTPNAKISPSFIGMKWKTEPLPFPALSQSSELNLLFIGRLDWYPNTEGLKWFLEKIWTALINKRQTITLNIVGGFYSNEFKKFCLSFPNVHFHGRVDEVESYYQKSHLTIIPIWTGSGTRVKAIESAQFARSFITTKKGIEGVELLAGEDYLESEIENEWIEKLATITPLECQKLGEILFGHGKNTYDQLKIQRDFMTNLQGLKK